jgi:uncharacterized cupin superfamily protein
MIISPRGLFPALAACAAVLLAVPAVGAPAIAPLARDAGPSPKPGRYPAEMVAPGQKGFDGSFFLTPIFRDAKGDPLVQIWESQAGVLKTEDYPFDEYCLVLEGVVEVTNQDGGTHTFRTGDTFVIPKGWRGTWDMKTRFRKHSIILSSPDEASAAALRQLMK